MKSKLKLHTDTTAMPQRTAAIIWCVSVCVIAIQPASLTLMPKTTKNLFNGQDNLAETVPDKTLTHSLSYYYLNL